VRSDIEVFIEHHRGPDSLNPDQFCSQSATYALMSFHHFSMFCTVVLFLTYISVVFARKIWQKMVRLHGEGSIGESKTSTRWLCTLVEGGIAMYGESMVPF
jgi:hypothetical protein